jgi:AcrR family transcriptional regulator
MLDMTIKPEYPNNRPTGQFTSNQRKSGVAMSPRPDVSEERKDQILDAASEVFAEKGVHETRMDDIVEKSGLSKGTLYWYFKSKDEIVLNIFERIFAREFKELESLIDSSDSASERLLHFADRASDDVKRMLRLMPLAYEFMGWAFRKKFVQDAFKLYINKFMDVLVPVIQQGIDTGEFREIDPQSAAITLGAIFEGTILLWVYDNTLVDIEKHIKEGITLLLEGMQT